MRTDTRAHTELVTGPPQETWPSQPVLTEAADLCLQSSQQLLLLVSHLSVQQLWQGISWGFGESSTVHVMLSDASPEAEVTGTLLWAASGTTAPRIHPSTHSK